MAIERGCGTRAPMSLLLSILRVLGANLALVVGGGLIGAAAARAWTRRELEAKQAAEQRAHGLRVRALEAGRLEAIAELGRAANELARLALIEGRKSPRRASVGPTPGPLPEWLPGIEFLPIAHVSLGADALGAQSADDAPAPRAAAEPEAQASAARAASSLQAALAALSDPPYSPASTAAPTPSPKGSHVPRNRAESWSIPLVPLPRRASGTG